MFVAYNFQQFKTVGESTLSWLQKEFSALRTGRSTPTILDVVSVESYGSRVPINQVANITVQDARTIRITPWDKNVTQAIDVAIRESNLGLSVAVDDQGLRISFPELTADRRVGLIKVAKQKLEEARITIRGERERVLNDLDKKEKDGEMSKDDKFRAKEDLQKLVDEANRKLEDLSTRKEKEINE
ncbi:MAG: ribosome recycling factor [Parcubacteria bacterium C7867-005]|nr:MAG: ribosome recycling factor [Parcubacteria bacterium C7867-005]